MGQPGGSAPSRILIIKPSSLGDIVHALPVLAAAKAAWPNAHVSWLASNSFAPLLDGHPLLDEVIRFDRARYGRMLRSPRVFVEFVRFVRELRRRRFDLVIDLQGLVRSGFLAWTSGAKRRVGFADARELAHIFYTERVRCPGSAVHAVDRNVCVARELGLPVDSSRFPLAIRVEEIEAAGQRLARLGIREGEPFAVLIPGARWPTKRWPARNWADLAGRLHGSGMSSVLLGAPDDRAFADEVLSAIRWPVADLVGSTTLREMCAVLSLAEVVISNDSGPLHVAAALGKPTVSLFGPTSPERTGPYDWTHAGGAHTVLRVPLDCAPCLRRSCRFSPADVSRHHACMASLDVDAVAAALGTRLARAHLASATAPT